MNDTEQTKSFNTASFKIGEPCSHPGCLSHISHPCETCGRLAGGFGDLARAIKKEITPKGFEDE